MWTRESEFDDLVAAAATTYGVPAPLIKAVIGVESGFNPGAINTNDPGSAWGLMQMLPATARALGYPGPMESLLANPSLAITLGTRLLRDNLARSSGNVTDAVSAYNGGFRPELGFGRPLPSGRYGNQAYVDRVSAAYQYFGGGGAGGVPGPFRDRRDPVVVDPPLARPTGPSARATWRVAGVVGAMGAVAGYCAYCT